MSVITTPSALKSTSSEVWTGLKESLYMHRIAWGMNRSAKPFLALTFITAIFSLIFIGAASLGTLIRYLASLYLVNDENVVGAFAMTYLGNFSRGEMGAIGALALAVCVASAVFSPIPGTMSTSVVTPKQVAPYGLNKWHRFFDSIISQAFASVAMLELVILLGLTSIITLDGGRNKGLVVSIFIWLLLNAVSIFILWVVEFLYRKYGSKTRAIIMGSISAIIALALIIDPNHGKTVFGLGTLFMGYIDGIDAHSWGSILIFGVVTVALILSVLAVAGMFSAKTLMLPENTKNPEQTTTTVFTKYKQKFNITTKRTWQIFLNTLVRSPNLYKPVIFVVIIGWIGSFIIPNSVMMGSTFALSIPMIVGLAWGSNALAHLSGGGVWLNAQGLLKNAPWIVFFIQFISSIVLVAIVWLPSLAAGITKPDTFLMNMLLAVTTSLVISRSAMSKSFAHPTPLHFGSRAESTLSPLKTLEYLARFAFFGGQIGILLTSAEVGVMIVLVVAGLVACWQWLRIAYTNMKWSVPSYRGQQLSKIAIDD